MSWDGKIKNTSIFTAVLFILLAITACGGASGDEISFPDSAEPGPDGVDIPITIAKVELDPHRINVVINEDYISFAGQAEAVSPYIEDSFVHITNTITGKHTFVPVNSDGSFRETALAVDDLTNPIRLAAYSSGTEGTAIYCEAEDLYTFGWYNEDGELIFLVEEDGTPESADEAKTVKVLEKNDYKADPKSKPEPKEPTCDIDEIDIEIMAKEAGLPEDYTILEKNCEYVVQSGQSFYYVDGEKYKLRKVLYIGYEKIKKTVLSEDGSTLGVLTNKYIYLVDLASGSVKKLKFK